jgi:hypothetical protein
MIGCIILAAENTRIDFLCFQEYYGEDNDCIMGTTEGMVPFNPNGDEDPFGLENRGAFYTTFQALSDLKGKKIINSSECVFSSGRPKLPFTSNNTKPSPGSLIGCVFQVPGGYFWAGHESNGNPATAMTTCDNGEQPGDCYEAFKAD